MNENEVSKEQLLKWQKFLVENPDVKALYEEEFLDQVHILKSALKNRSLEKVGVDQNVAAKAYHMGEKLLDYLNDIDSVKIDTSLDGGG